MHMVGELGLLSLRVAKRLQEDLIVALKYFLRVSVCQKTKCHIFHIALDCQGPVTES